MQKIVTHNGGFHADEVFAVATLQLFLGTQEVDIIRTRDESIIDEANWVVDVGGVYDESKNRFDHHQNGAPVRENGIPYAAFGLVWKHVGEAVSGSAEVAAKIEEKLVLPIDAGDTGISLFTLNEKDVSPLTISGVVSLFCPMQGSGEDVDAAFIKMVNLAREIIEISIKRAKAKQEMKALVEEVYLLAENKKVLLFEHSTTSSLLIDYPEVLLMVNPSNPEINDNWSVVAVPVKKGSFETRISFPETWRGLLDDELAEVSGVTDAIFCHKNGFLFVSASKEGALEASKKCLELS